MSDEGMVRKDGYRRNRVEIPVGMVVTDRRLVFAAVGGDGSDAGTLAYDELAGVDVEHETLVFSTTDGVCWRFPLADPGSGDGDIAVRHLCWVGKVRNRLVGTQNDVELATGKIRTQAADLAWEDALDTYRKARTQLDDLVCLVQCTTPLRDGVLAPELVDLDRQLESACARLYIERARSQLELATQLVQYGDYEQARKVFDEARHYTDRARWHTEEIKRADAFQFGRQRDLAHNLEELRWEIESAAVEPLQQAKEASIQAEAADTLSTEIEHLEAALRRYRGIRTLAWYEHFDESPESIDEVLRETAAQLIDRHERAARTRWNDGSRLEAESDLGAAIRECTVATEHLERASDLAGEFDPERASAFESRLKRMSDLLLDMQERADARQTSEGTARESDSGDTDAAGAGGIERGGVGESLEAVPESGERVLTDLPTLDDLADVDLHHDITLDLTGDANPLRLEADGDSLDLDGTDDPLNVASDDPEDRAGDEQDADEERQSSETESV